MSKLEYHWDLSGGKQMRLMIRCEDGKYRPAAHVQKVSEKLFVDGADCPPEFNTEYRFMVFDGSPGDATNARTFGGYEDLADAVSALARHLGMKEITELVP